MSLHKELQIYLNNHFTYSKLSPPLFYTGEYYLRFDLQNDNREINFANYLLEVNSRINEIFNAITNNDDDVILYYNCHTWRRQKIRRNNYLFKQVTTPSPTYQFKRTNCRELQSRYSNYHTCQLIIEEKASNINFANIFSAIANADNGINPKLDGELYIINKTKNIIIYMYDDRGCDVFSNNKNLITEYYQKLSPLVLEYNREDILKRLR